MTDSVSDPSQTSEPTEPVADKAPETAPSPTDRLMQYFAFQHLQDGPLRDASKLCCQLAERVVAMVPDGPEKTVGLRKLLEAKDCFVRASLPAKNA